MRGSGGLGDETALPAEASQLGSAYGTQGPLVTLESGGIAKAWGPQESTGASLMQMLAAAGARGALTSASGGRPLTSPLWGMHAQGAVAAVLPPPPKMGYFEVEMNPQVGHQNNSGHREPPRLEAL